MLYAVIAVIIFALGAGSAVKVEEWRFAAKEAAQVKAQHEAQVAEDKRTNTIAARFAKAIADLKVNNAATNAKVLNELAQAVYTQCVVPDSGRVLLDSSADALNAAAGLAPAPAANPAPVPKPAGKNDDGRPVPARSGLDAALQRLRNTGSGTTSGGSGGASPATK